MSKFDELIKEYCPDGVEYKTINSICLNISSGGTPNSKRSDYYGGDIPWLRTQEVNFSEIIDTEINITEEGLNNSSAKWIPSNCVIIAMYGATVGKVAWNKNPLTTNQACCNLEIDEDIADYKYVYYCLANMYQHIRSLGQGSQTNINAQIVKGLLLPVPPLEVQREIVRVLDKFTLLTAELTAELTARKKQYEYYRDNLLSKHKETPKKSIDSLCKVSAGGDAPRDAMSKEKTEEYTIPIISNGVGDNAIYGYTNEARITEPAVTVAARGTIGYAEYRDYPYVPIIRLLSLIPKDEDELDTKYLYYCLQGKEYNVPTTGIPQLTAPMVKQVEIPVPEIKVQRRIVEVLDNFDKICTDLNIGLPAEINARQKQYEFYRDQLLTFIEKGETIQTDRQTDRA